MNRRQLLARGGLGSLALASLPALGHSLAKGAFADHEGTEFIFVAFSSAGTVDGVLHLVAVTGHGSINPTQVVGGGVFTHLNGITGEAIGLGTWRTRELLRYNPIGWAGVFGAGTFQAVVDLLPQVAPPGTPPTLTATLEMACNVEPAGLITGKPEGVVLTVGGIPLPPFVPLEPPLGLTAFTRHSAA